MIFCRHTRATFSPRIRIQYDIEAPRSPLAAHHVGPSRRPVGIWIPFLRRGAFCTADGSGLLLRTEMAEHRSLPGWSRRVRHGSDWSTGSLLYGTACRG